MRRNVTRFGNLLLFSAAALMTVACSGIPRAERDKAQMDRFLQYAGPPVDRITYLGRYDGWQSLGRYQLVVWTNLNDAYLITVTPPCEDLPFANRIGFTQTGHTLYARFDFLLVHHWRCPIQEIRPVNYLKMKQDARAEREQQKAEKAAAQSGSGVGTQ
jgi:hypothetical protein